MEGFIKKWQCGKTSKQRNAIERSRGGRSIKRQQSRATLWLLTRHLNLQGGVALLVTKHIPCFADVTPRILWGSILDQQIRCSLKFFPIEKPNIMCIGECIGRTGESEIRTLVVRMLSWFNCRAVGSIWGRYTKLGCWDMRWERFGGPPLPSPSCCKRSLHQIEMESERQEKEELCGPELVGRWKPGRRKLLRWSPIAQSLCSFLDKMF